MNIRYPRERGGRRLLLEAFEINAVSRCNLACVACSRSAPVAAPGFADPAVVLRDLKELSSVAFAKTVRINGGEPLLHPRLGELLLAVRRSGITDCIEVYTNGTLLDSRKRGWLEHADKIHLSSYPASPVSGANVAWLARLCRKKGKGLLVKDFQFFRRWQAAAPLGQAAREVFELCQSAHAYSCHSVDDGRVYMCIQSLAAGDGPGETCAIRPLATLGARLEKFLLRRRPLKLCGRCLGSCGDLMPHRQAPPGRWRKLSSGGRLNRECLDLLRQDPWRELECSKVRLDIPRAGRKDEVKLPGVNWKRLWSSGAREGRARPAKPVSRSPKAR